MLNKFKKWILTVITIMLIITSTFITASARGGGGGSGGSGGGSGGGGGSSSSSSHYYGNDGSGNGSSSPFSLLFFIGIIFVMRKKNTIMCIINVQFTRRKVGSAIRKIKNNGSYYVYNNMKSDISEAYFNLQEAWTKRDISICKRNLTPGLRDYYKSKLEWMVVKHEINVLENVRLLQAVPVSLKHFRDYNMDEIWVFIVGRMKDYTINELSKSVINGTKFNKNFIEFWQFKVKDDKWVLNKIFQEDEFNFNTCDVFIENGDNELLKDKLN